MDTAPRCVSDDVGKLLLRLAVGGLMLFHGINKIVNGLGPIPGYLEDAGMGAVAPVAYAVFLGEVLGPVLILIGFWTRIGALLEALSMVMAVWLVHTRDLLKLDDLGGWKVELQAWFFLGSLALLFMGPGRFSISGGKGRLG